MVLDGPRLCKRGMTAHDRHGDDLGPIGGNSAGDFRHVNVEANHHADLSEASGEDGELAAADNALAVFAPGQTKFAIGADKFAVGAQHDGGVVHLMAILLEERSD